MLAMAMPRDDPDQGVISVIAGLPAVKEALAQRDAAVTAERDRKIRDLSQLEAAAELAAPKRAAQLERLTADVQKIEAALRAAQQRLALAHMEKHEAAVEFGRRHDEIEASLRATASPLIARFVAEMRAEWDKTRRTPLTQETATTATKSAATGRPETYLKTNAAAVTHRLRAIRETILAAETLAISVTDQNEIPERLGAMAAKLPPP